MIIENKETKEVFTKVAQTGYEFLFRDDKGEFTEISWTEIREKYRQIKD